ncbi:MAG: tetratricopeptide repeat protein [Hyphomicrobiaceae bacterium]|nr:tetratricopeptide repeat protein [Hyphomicrobiaceae bacterium]
MAKARAIKNGDMARLVALVGAGKLAEAEPLFDRRFKLGDRAAELIDIGKRIKLSLKRWEDVLTLGALLDKRDPVSALDLNDIAAAQAALGRLTEAEVTLVRAAKIEPNLPSIWLNLGQVLRQRGNHVGAAKAFEQLVKLAPGAADAYFQLGQSLRELRQNPQAAQCFAKAVQLKPEMILAQAALARTLDQLGRKADAVRHYEIAVAGEPNSIELRFQYGRVLHELDRIEDAIPLYRRVLEINPQHLGALNNLGVALAKGGREDEAAARDVRAKRRDDAAEEMNRLDEAISIYQRVVALDPNYAPGWSNLGNAYFTLGDFPKCRDAYARALAINPKEADPYSSLGSTLQWGGEFEEAERLFRTALAMRPDFPNCEFNIATLLLLLGRWEEGWHHYESRFRWHRDKYDRPDLKRWDGKDPVDPGLLVIANEQGLGDSLQFIRFVPLMRERGYNVVIQMEPRIHTIIKDAFPDYPTVTIGDRIPAGAKYWFPLMSIPKFVGTTVDTVPAKVPYLRARPKLVEKWSQRLGTHGFKIAFAWQGNPKRRVDLGRSFALDDFAAFADIPGVRLIAIQKGVGLGQLATCAFRDRIELPGEDFDSGPDAFLDTAAVMQMADLVITPDTSIVHLAGALGRPAMLGVKKVPDWRWLLDREDSPFYPTVKLYRQSVMGQWGDVIARMAADVRKRVAG